MSPHLTDQQLNAYLHQTLTDAQRETLDAHLMSCPNCRAQLAELNVVQQRVRRELTAELKTLNVPLSLTFAALAPQLKRQRTIVLRQLVMIMTAAAAVIALIIILAVTAHTPQPIPATTTSMLAANQVANSAGLSVNADANGWHLAGSTPENYRTGVDRVVTHAGKASGYISSTVSSSNGFGTWMQMFKADEYRGKRLRLSAYIKAENVQDWAGLWMRVDGPENKVLSLDNMENRPIRGTVDWQQVAIVLDVPQNSVGIAFGILLQGAGRVWIDNVQFEVVGSDVSTTQLPEDPTPLISQTTSLPSVAPVSAVQNIERQPTNLDFETGSTGWSSTDSDTREYISGIDPTVAHLGQASGSIESLMPRPGGLGLLRQTVKADNYRDKRVRVSGYLKTDKLNGTAFFLMTIYGQPDQMIYANSRSISGISDWQLIQFVLNVPANSDHLEYGLALRGEGQVWLDDVNIKEIGNDIELSSIEALPVPVGPNRLGNLDFEAGEGLQAWLNTGNPDYLVGVDHSVVHSENTSGYIRSVATVSTGSYEVLSQFVRAADYQGKRLRFSSYIKTDQVKGWAGIWMNVTDFSNQLLGLGNMQDRPITGTTGWQKYEIVLDIPEDSAMIGLGTLLQGEGEIWMDDVQLEVVGQDVPTTTPYQQEPLNLDFENSK